MVENLQDLTKKGKVGGRKGLRQAALVYGPNSSSSSTDSSSSSSTDSSSSSTGATPGSPSSTCTSMDSCSTEHEVKFKLKLGVLSTYELDMLLPSRSSATYTIDISILDETLCIFDFSEQKPLTLPSVLPNLVCTTSPEVMDTMHVVVKLMEGHKVLATGLTKLPQQSSDMEVSVQLSPSFTIAQYDELLPCTQPPTVTLGIQVSMDTEEPAGDTMELTDDTGLSAPSSPLAQGTNSEESEEQVRICSVVECRVF